MKKRNIAELYFCKKSMSIFEILLIVIAVVSAFACFFLDGGIPTGLPIFITATVLLGVIKSKKPKDDDIDTLLKKILQSNNIICTNNTLEGYEYKNTILKKRKDGKIISPIYYLTNVMPDSNNGFTFYVNKINLFDSSVEKNTFNNNGEAKLSLIDEEIQTNLGKVMISYILSDGSIVSPVSLSDYNTEQLVKKITQSK